MTLTSTEIFINMLYNVNHMKLKTVSIRLKEQEFEDLESLVESEGYHSKSELVRELIKNKWDSWAEKTLKHAKAHPEEFENWSKAKVRL